MTLRKFYLIYNEYLDFNGLKKKGEELNENLEGLKNYLKDYSNIHEKDEKSLTLWEDYLIYSVIFNQNTKVIKNIWNKYISI